jgi:hypothetical protein
MKKRYYLIPQESALDARLRAYFAKLAESIYDHSNALLYFLQTNVLRRTLNEIYFHMERNDLIFAAILMMFCFIMIWFAAIF